MNEQKSRKKAIGGIVFGLGIIGLLIGTLTDVYSTSVGVIIMLGTWFILGPILVLIMPKKEAGPDYPKAEEQKPEEPRQEPPKPEGENFGQQ